MKEKNLSKTIEQSIWTPVLRKKLVTDTPVWIKRLRFQPPKKISKS